MGHFRITESERREILNLHNNAKIINEQATPQADKDKIIKIQQLLKTKYNVDLGTSGANKDGIDGVLGPKTLAALNSKLGTKTPAAPAAASTTTPAAGTTTPPAAPAATTTPAAGTTTPPAAPAATTVPTTTAPVAAAAAPTSVPTTTAPVAAATTPAEPASTNDAESVDDILGGQQEAPLTSSNPRRDARRARQDLRRQNRREMQDLRAQQRAQ